MEQNEVKLKISSETRRRRVFWENFRSKSPVSRRRRTHSRRRRDFSRRGELLAGFCMGKDLAGGEICLAAGEISKVRIS